MGHGRFVDRHERQLLALVGPTGGGEMPGVAGEYGVAPDDADDAINVLVVTAQQQREIGAPRPTDDGDLPAVDLFVPRRLFDRAIDVLDGDLVEQAGRPLGAEVSQGQKGVSPGQESIPCFFPAIAGPGVSSFGTSQPDDQGLFLVLPQVEHTFNIRRLQAQLGHCTKGDQSNQAHRIRKRMKDLLAFGMLVRWRFMGKVRFRADRADDAVAGMSDRPETVVVRCFT